MNMLSEEYNPKRMEVERSGAVRRARNVSINARMQILSTEK
jgi:hypothetical protein